MRLDRHKHIYTYTNALLSICGPDIDFKPNSDARSHNLEQPTSLVHPLSGRPSHTLHQSLLLVYLHNGCLDLHLHCIHSWSDQWSWSQTHLQALWTLWPNRTHLNHHTGIELQNSLDHHHNNLKRKPSLDTKHIDDKSTQVIAEVLDRSFGHFRILLASSPWKNSSFFRRHSMRIQFSDP